MVSFYYYCFIELAVFNANSGNPDQMQHYAASKNTPSDLGLHCFCLLPFQGGGGGVAGSVSPTKMG